MRVVEQQLLESPRAGVVVLHAGRVRKQRVALPGRGKSDSARIIYLFVAPDARVLPTDLDFGPFAVTIPAKASCRPAKRALLRGGPPDFPPVGPHTRQAESPVAASATKRLGCDITEGAPAQASAKGQSRADIPKRARNVAGRTSTSLAGEAAMIDRSEDKPFGNKTFGESLIASMEEALAYKRGETELRTRLVERTAPETRLDPPPPTTARASERCATSSTSRSRSSSPPSPSAMARLRRGSRAGAPRTARRCSCSKSRRSIPKRSWPRCGGAASRRRATLIILCRARPAATIGPVGRRFARPGASRCNGNLSGRAL